MKKVLSFLLLLAFAAQSFGQAIIVADFYINQSYIAATKCENRYRPMLHCNGKCQLAIKMKQEEKKNEQNPERKLENKNEVISSRSFFAYDIIISARTYPDHIVSSDKNTMDISYSIFHPPCYA